MKTPTSQDFSPVAALRPTDSDLDADWTAERKAAVLSHITAGIAAESAAEVIAGRHDASEHAAGDLAVPGRVAPIHDAPAATSAVPHRVSRRRAVLITSGIAAAVAALLAVPLLVPSGSPAGPPSATALEALAVTAAAESPLQPGQFRHTVTHDRQNGNPITRESWTAADGHLWRIDTASGTSMYYAFPPGGNDISNPSPAFLATLPTDTDALGEYLRTHVHGSMSTDEAVFVAVGDMLSGGFAPPALRATALRVLEQTPHVTAHPGYDSLERAATIVEFVDGSIRPGEVQSLYFDPATAELLQSGSNSRDSDFTSTIASTAVVNSVPTRVLRWGTADGMCLTAAGIQDDLVCVKALTIDGASTEATAMPTASIATSAEGSAEPAN